MTQTAAQLLPILSFPDPRLHTIAKPVDVAALTGAQQSHYQKLAADMFATMYEAEGIGLAATQVDVHERFIVIDLSDDTSGQLVLINPEVIWASEETAIGEEGCLSVPGIRDAVPRAVEIKVKAFNLQGQEQIIEAKELMAVCIQHEMDHLLGKVFVEYLSPLKLGRIKTKLLKAQKQK